MTPVTINQILNVWPVFVSVATALTSQDFRFCVLVSKEWHRLFTPELYRVLGNKDCSLSLNHHLNLLLDPTSPLRQLYSLFVQELIVNSSLLLPVTQDSHSLSSAPVFPNLKRLCQRIPPSFTTAPTVQVPRATTIQVERSLNFLELHSRITEVEIVLLNMTEDAFDRLCMVVEHHSSLKSIRIISNWFRSSSHPYQRFTWACRRLANVSIEVPGIYPWEMTDSPARIIPEQDVKLICGDNLGKGKSRIELHTLKIIHTSSRDNWIYFPMLQMCTNLEKLELKVHWSSDTSLQLAFYLHSFCPKLSSICIWAIPGPWDTQQDMNQAVKLLCSLSNSNTPVFSAFISDTGETHATSIQQPKIDRKHHSTSCCGFHLKAFVLIPCYEVEDLHFNGLLGSWDGLAGHHGPSLKELNLNAIKMGFREFLGVVSQLPNLEVLSGCTRWNSREHLGTTTDSRLPTLTCLGLKSLELYIDDNPFDNMTFEKYRDQCFERKAEASHQGLEPQPDSTYGFGREVYHIRHLTSEIGRMHHLKSLQLKSSGKWNSTFSFQGAYGCLGPLSDLTNLESVCWRERVRSELTTEETDWILKHWPNLKTFHGGMLSLSGGMSKGIEYLISKKQGLTILYQ
ncbi:hypothetical protein EMPS_00149 [Entomortierella parvispora]|uniref:Uncharacterized protein n=1 Tax=Entomortierella parvispora TaxID=205924 RepID=A0A9P3GZF1_9FUNG|nr:hypothetical protein EMPS_00149 [Entomortierella parvispora]